VIVGIALIGVPNKAPLLAVLAVAGQAVSKATTFVLALTPYGVFAIAAVVAGTLGLEDLQRLEAYLVSYVAIALFLSLWVLPGLVAALTPVPYRALLSRTREALLTAFMTTSLFAVLPLITEEAKSLMREYTRTGVDDPATDVIVPTSFNFPHTAKLLSLSFVLFAGWFADAHVAVADKNELRARMVPEQRRHRFEHQVDCARVLSGGECCSGRCFLHKFGGRRIGRTVLIASE